MLETRSEDAAEAPVAAPLSVTGTGPFAQLPLLLVVGLYGFSVCEGM